MNMEELGNWADLPTELTAQILSRLSVIDILKNAQNVCKSWHHVCKDPLMWRKIDMDKLGFSGYMYRKNLKSICRHAVDRSKGGLVEINISYFCNDELLNYIADRSSNLRNLRLYMCSTVTDKGIIEAVGKLPLLEYLKVSRCSVSAKSMTMVPYLRLFKVKHKPNDCDGFTMTQRCIESIKDLNRHYHW